MQSSVYATCTDWNFFSGNPLFIAARCRFTFTYSTVPVGGICRSFTMLQKELFVRGSPFQIRAICYAVQDLCTHVGLPFTCCKKNNKQGEVAHVENWNQRKWGYPGPDLGFWSLMTHVLTKFMQGIILSNTQIT